MVRQYYIAAERQLWDHIPQKADACSGGLQPLTGDNALRASNNASLGTIGSQRWRGTFYEYTDATFAARKVCDSPVYFHIPLRQQADVDSPVNFSVACTAIKGSRNAMVGSRPVQLLSPVTPTRECCTGATTLNQQHARRLLPRMQAASCSN